MPAGEWRNEAAFMLNSEDSFNSFNSNVFYVLLDCIIGNIAEDLI